MAPVQNPAKPAAILDFGAETGAVAKSIPVRATREASSKIVPFALVAPLIVAAWGHSTLAASRFAKCDRT